MELKYSFLLLGLLLVIFPAKARQCSQGFARKKEKCEDIDECGNNPCGNNSHCHNTNGSYYCKCINGFKNVIGNKTFTATNGDCRDINECYNSSTCPKNSECKNSIGSYTCNCSQGFQNVNGSVECTDIDECALVPPVCGLHGLCSNTHGTFTCTCPMGFRNRGNSSTECHDIDECLNDKSQLICGEHGECNNLQGSYTCSCNSGYTNYSNNETMCIEVKCEQKMEIKQAAIGELLNLYMSECKSLSQPKKQQQTGETLLKHLLNATNKVMSSGDVNDSSTMSTFLGAMEHTLHLIGPQLSQPLTTIHNDVSEACLAVKKGSTPPNGRVMVKTGDVELSMNWKTAVGEQYPGFAYVGLVSYKNLNGTNTFVREETETETDKRNASYRLKSKVVTALISNKHTENLPEPITLTFNHLKDEAVSPMLNYSCVYWEETENGGAWSGRGCVKMEFNSTHATCTWSHLSSFAVLMALYPIKDSFELTLITQIGLSLSLVCLFLCILTFRFCRSIKGTRTTIHLHLCLCLFIADFIFLFFITSTQSKVGCAIVAGLLHFFFLSAFCWMLLDGIQLYRLVVQVFQTPFRTLYMVAMGYGVPLTIVVISAIAYSKGYGTDVHCWLSLEKDFIWSFFAPVCVIVIANIFFFVITIFKLAEKFSSLNPDHSKLKKLRAFVVTAMAQLCVLGGMWVFGCFLFQEQGTVVMLYLFTLLNSLQGALIFVMHCLMRKTVRQEYLKLCGGVCATKKKRYSEFSTNQSSNSQKPLRSAQSTGESQI